MENYSDAADHDDPGYGLSNGVSSSKGAPKFKKAPDAPKRFKSAFIIFSSEKHKQIKQKLAQDGRHGKTTDIAKMVSEAWRGMDPEEKAVWEEKARADKARYEAEKAMYKGPWKVPASKRTPKDPTAPKRPMSAFLAYSNKRRAGLKKENPNLTNADLSKMLSKAWKEESEQVRKKYTDEERDLREKYKVDMTTWRKKAAEDRKHERKQREAQALKAAKERKKSAKAAKAAPKREDSGSAAEAVPFSAGVQEQSQVQDRQQNLGLTSQMNLFGLQQLNQLNPVDQNRSMMSPFGGSLPNQGAYANPQQQLLSQLMMGQQNPNAMGGVGNMGLFQGMGGQGGFGGGFGLGGANYNSMGGMNNQRALFEQQMMSQQFALQQQQQQQQMGQNPNSDNFNDSLFFGQPQGDNSGRDGGGGSYGFHG